MNTYTPKLRFSTIKTACILFGPLFIFICIPMVVHAQEPYEYSDEVTNEILNLIESGDNQAGLICSCHCMTDDPQELIVTADVIVESCSYTRQYVEGTKCTGYTKEDVEVKIETDYFVEPPKTIKEEEGRYYCLARAGGDPE